MPAHVLFLDHSTGGPFLAYKGNLSMGSYDDARMWIEIAQRLKNEMDISTMHLFGVSMSRQTAVERGSGIPTVNPTGGSADFPSVRSVFQDMLFVLLPQEGAGSNGESYRS